METNQNIQKGIRNLLIRILTVLIIVPLSFHVWSTPKVVLAYQQTEEPTEEVAENLMYDLWYVDGLLCRITTTAYSEKLHAEVVKILNGTNRILEKYPNSIPNVHACYNKQKEKFDRYNTAITGAIEKLETLTISKDMDISQVIGFTANEFEQILLNARDTRGNLLVTDDDLAWELAEGIVNAVEMYPVNEMFVIGIMGFETGHFKSPSVINHHNYAGDKVNGEIMHFETDAEGISKGVKYIYDNMIATGPTIRDVNMRYCEIDPPPEEETEQEKEERIYRWANKVVSSMKMYAKIER